MVCTLSYIMAKLGLGSGVNSGPVLYTAHGQLENLCLEGMSL